MCTYNLPAHMAYTNIRVVYSHPAAENEEYVENLKVSARDEGTLLRIARSPHVQKTLDYLRAMTSQDMEVHILYDITEA